MSPNSTILEGRGHFARWGRHLAQQMSVIGLKFFCPEQASAMVYVDDIEAVGVTAQPVPLQIVDLSANGYEIKRFERFELTFRLTEEFDNPFDPDQVRVDARFTGPDGQTATVPGFFYLEHVRRQLPGGEEETIPVGKGCWKVRFTPRQVGPYRCEVMVATGGGEQSATSTELAFRCEASENRGFVRVSKDDPRYFEFTTGEFFYPIGHNFRSPNDPRGASMLNMELPVDRGTFAYDDMLAKMAANGENLFEVWMASWWLGLEWTAEWTGYHGVGQYNLANAWKLDYVIDKADSLGLYVHLVLDNHGKGSWWVDTEWWNSPYRDVNGGFLHSPDELFTNARAKRMYKNRLRYIVARWGYSPRLMGLELWSEVDLTMSSMQFGRDMPKGHEVKIAWHREMIDELKRIDPWDHMATTHYSANYNRIDPHMVALDEIEYIVSDAYRGEYGLGPQMRINDILRDHANFCAKWKKPTFVTEYGGTPHGAEVQMLEADLHAGLWGGYMTTQAGTPLMWWFDYIDRENKYYHYKALAAFHEGEDRRGKNYEMADATVLDSPVTRLRVPVRPGAEPNTIEVAVLDAMCLKNETSAYVWVYDKAEMLRMKSDRAAQLFKGISVSVPSLATGPYNVEIWDTYAGSIVKQFTVENDSGSVRASLPDFKRDIALKIKRTD